MNDSTFDQTHRRSKRVRRAILIILAALLAAGWVVARELGRWLVVQDPLDRSGAIVVLSGGLPYRAVEGAKIYREGIAPQVWLTRSQEPAELEEWHIDYEGEETYDRKILIHEGVPDSAIRVLDPIITNTVDEERAVFDKMRRSAVSRVIIVTSPPHTRRVRTLWRNLAPNGLVAIVRAASTDPYDANHWWRNTKDALDVTREVLGLLNAWAGLPLKPPPRPAT